MTRLVAAACVVLASLCAHAQRMEDFIAEIKSVPRAAGVGEIFYPGEMEARNDQRLRREGIALPGDTVEDLRRLASECGIAAGEALGS